MDHEFIGGRNPVFEALKSGRSIHKIWVADGVKPASIHNLLQQAKENGVIVQISPKKKLDEFNVENHQGVIAQVAAYEYAELEDLFEKAAVKNEPPFFIILDEIEDPHNLGSIMRTADAVGAHGIIIPKRRAVGLTQAVAKASTGAIEHIPVVRVTNLSQTIETLKKQGLWIMAADLKKSKDYRELDGNFPLAVVIGSEGKGVSRLVSENCDFIYRIPMVGHVSSLNASVSASIMLYEIYRKRNPL